MADATLPTSPSPSTPASPSASPAAPPSAITSPAPTPSSPPVQAASPQLSAAAPAVRPAYVFDEGDWDATSGKIKDEAKFAERIKADAAFVAAERSRKLTLPQSPDAYKNDLPADFKPPEGSNFKIDDADPLIGRYRALAHESGLDQATYSKGLGLIAALRVGEAAEMKAAYTAEVAKLGAAGPQRVDAVVQWLNAFGGEKAAPLANMFKIAPVASTIEAVEHIMQRVSSQGVAPFNQAHRATEPAGKIAGFDKMSFAQQREAQERIRAQRAR